MSLNWLVINLGHLILSQPWWSYDEDKTPVIHSQVRVWFTIFWPTPGPTTRWGKCNSRYLKTHTEIGIDATVYPTPSYRLPPQKTTTTKQQQPTTTSLIPCRKTGSLYQGKAVAATQAVLPIPTSACSIFMCPNNGMVASVWDFNKYTDVDAYDCTGGLYEYHRSVCTKT